MLTEAEYLDIIERYQRASAGDGTVMPQLLMVDIALLIADWRQWQRRVNDLHEQISGELPAIHARLAALEEQIGVDDDGSDT